jgi:hypothetical protein
MNLNTRFPHFHQLLCRLHDSCGISDVKARLYSQSAVNYGLYSKHSSTYNHSLIGASEQCGSIMFIWPRLLGPICAWFGPCQLMLRACPWLTNLRCCDVQVEFEFDFIKEAGSMDRISESLRAANWGKAPIAIPQSVPGLVTKYVPFTQILCVGILLMWGCVVLDRFLKFCISCLSNIYASVAVQGIVPNVY